VGNLVKVGDEEGLCTISGVAFVLCLSNYPFFKTISTSGRVGRSRWGRNGILFFPKSLINGARSMKEDQDRFR